MAIFLLAFGAGFIFVIQEILYKKYWNYGLKAQIRFQDYPAVEGESAVLDEIVTNEKFLPLPMLHVKFQVSRNLIFDSEDNINISDFCYKNDIFSMMIYQRITRRISFLCKNRGFYTISRIDVVSSNLFMDKQYVDTIPQNTSFYVYPRLIADIQLEIPYRKMMGMILANRYIYEDPFEFRSIRDYERWDPLKAINWKASAKSGELKVNTYNYTAEQDVVFLLNLENDGIWHYDDLHEEGIRIVASLSKNLIEQGINVAVVSNGRDILNGNFINIQSGSSMLHIKVIMEQLSRIDLKLETDAFEDILEMELVKNHSINTVYVLISSSQRENTQKLFYELSSISTPTPLWILPLYSNMDLTISDKYSMDVNRWEVAKSIVH